MHHVCKHRNMRDEQEILSSFPAIFSGALFEFSVQCSLIFFVYFSILEFGEFAFVPTGNFAEVLGEARDPFDIC